MTILDQCNLTNKQSLSGIYTLGSSHVSLQKRKLIALITSVPKANLTLKLNKYVVCLAQCLAPEDAHWTLAPCSQLLVRVSSSDKACRGGGGTIWLTHSYLLIPALHHFGPLALGNTHPDT